MSVDLRQMFLSLQKELDAKLQTNRTVVDHPTVKGDATEIDWIGTLESYLPERYAVARAFVLDHEGQLSEQIDLVIYDRQYSTLLFNHAGARYVPAESVYAVFEVKQEVSKATVEYAGEKAASVRRLARTSAPITHAGGTFEPRTPFAILAGILALESTWSPPVGDSFVDALRSLKDERALDIGCVLRHGAFDAAPSSPDILWSRPDTALVFFYLHLLDRLQRLGTVPAIDYRLYGGALIR